MGGEPPFLTQKFMDKPDSVRCKNCMFFASTKNGKNICVFNPPTNNPNNIAESIYAMIEPNWWCGRFRPKDNLTAVE